MKIILCSDTHGKHNELNKDLESLKIDNDNTIFIHSGDCTNVGRPEELTDFLNWFSMLPYKHKIFIAGNHDFCFEMITNRVDDTPIYIDIEQQFKNHGVIYLMDQMVEIEGLKIYGSPWQPRFFDWAFNVNRGDDIAKKWEAIPKDLDVLITHGPPYGILDSTITGMRVGCEELYKKVVEVSPKIHVFGHIHCSYGYKEFNGTSFFNASSLGENYEYQNKPILVTLDKNRNIVDIEAN